jgi:hypothetical protein
MPKKFTHINGTEPTVEGDALAVDDIWSDTTSGITIKKCTAVTPSVTWETLQTGGKSYTEALISFQATGSGAWEEKDLSGDGVPANAECEVLIWNSRTNAERQAGVREIGSSLNRLVDLHEAEGGGVTPMTQTVVANAQSKIEIYAETNTNITFVVTGYRS